MKQTLSVARKELGSYFGSPMAFIFLATFLAATLYAFFWVEAFFARGIADLRPLFRWMPILTIFLIAALTMRQWSEEQQSGTLEILLTLPIRPAQLVIGKFLAVMALTCLALLLTLPLPITVSILGDLDWGPVIGGYLATILLAAAYAVIGLFVSSRTNNQIVSLISTGIVGGLLYLVGTGAVTDFVGGRLAILLRAIGTGSRFESIERGVIDLRDLLYYASLIVLFLTLNAISIDAKRWSRGEKTASYRRNALLTAGLVFVNVLLVNIWLYPMRGLRVDLTENREFSLSDTTKSLLATLQEPLLIRAYISEKTHPLLLPLVPQIADLLEEYEVAGKGTITAEVVDPTKDPDLEAEAAQTYGIQPVPFQVSGRYESAVINSYFDILVRYGDQNVVLNFRDIIEIEPHRDGTIDVRLRNLEYDLTRAIKKVVYGFQSIDAVLAAMEQPAKLTLVATPKTLPEPIKDAPETIRKVAEEIAEKSEGKFEFEMIDPDAQGAALTRETLFDTYGLRPIAASLFSTDTYYLYMILETGQERRIVYPSGDVSEASVRTAIESALKRASTGFLKVVGLWTPPSEPKPGPFGQMQQPFASWRLIEDQLREDYTVRNVDLSTGYVPADIDVLLILAPQELGDKETFAVDQFLMRGGSVVVATGRGVVDPEPFTGQLNLKTVEGNLHDLLASYGIEIQEKLVMDPQNEPFPLAVTRNVGGFRVQEIRAVDYPFFVDVRPDAMDKESPITASLRAVTMNWVSPIELDPEKNKERTTHELLSSSKGSWLYDGMKIQPDYDLYPETGFPPPEEERGSYTLAVSVQGTFESYFKEKPSPFESSGDEESKEEESSGDGEEVARALGKIESSPESARLVVIGSSEFVNDPILQLSSRLTADRFRNNLQFLQNAVDWSVEDLDLLQIRARGSQPRVLKPMDEAAQKRWEAMNYAIALLALAAIGAIWYWKRRREKPLPIPAVATETAAD